MIFLLSCAERRRPAPFHIEDGVLRQSLDEGRRLRRKRRTQNQSEAGKRNRQKERMRQATSRLVAVHFMPPPLAESDSGTRSGMLKVSYPRSLACHGRDRGTLECQCRFRYELITSRRRRCRRTGCSGFRRAEVPFHLIF